MKPTKFGATALLGACRRGVATSAEISRRALRHNRTRADVRNAGNADGAAGDTATDALSCLKKVVGQNVALACPCG